MSGIAQKILGLPCARCTFTAAVTSALLDSAMVAGSEWSFGGKIAQKFSTQQKILC
jgi:hypothetical protein